MTLTPDFQSMKELIVEAQPPSIYKNLLLWAISLNLILMFTGSKSALHLPYAWAAAVILPLILALMIFEKFERKKFRSPALKIGPGGLQIGYWPFELVPWRNVVKIAFTKVKDDEFCLAIKLKDLGDDKLYGRVYIRMVSTPNIYALRFCKANVPSDTVNAYLSKYSDAYCTREQFGNSI